MQAPPPDGLFSYNKERNKETEKGGVFCGPRRYFSLMFLMMSITIPLNEGSLAIRFSTFWMA